MKHLNPVQFVHGIPDSMRWHAVALYDSAFGPKFSVAMPSDEQRLALLFDSINLSCAFGAIENDRLVGMAGYRTAEGAFTDGMTYKALLKHAGVIRGNWAAIVFSLYERSFASGQMLMDGIVVDSSARSRGIGTELLDRLVRFAGECEYDSVRLDVIETNTDARRMYERNGFTATHTEHFGYLKWLLGFGASTTMVRMTDCP
ncbi:MAG: GNAT family N-acetyltransferase [Aureliella sp.]